MAQRRQSLTGTAHQSSVTERKGWHIMANIRPFAKRDTLSKASIQPLLLCPLCNIEMCLFGTESESDKRDLYTFECVACGGLEVRGVQVKGVASVIIPIN
jgi:hypothetical protein